MDQNYTNAIFSTKKLRYSVKPGLTQAILPHSTQKKPTKTLSKDARCAKCKYPGKNFRLLMSCHKIFVTKCPVWGRLPVSPSNFKDSFWCKIHKKQNPVTKKHSQKPIHKQVGTEQDQRGQYLPRWSYALFLRNLCGLDTCIISKPHKQSYKSSIKTNFTSNRQDPFFQHCQRRFRRDPWQLSRLY